MLNIAGTGYGRLPTLLRKYSVYCALLACAGMAMAAANHKPTISGTPASSVAVGAKYSFKPKAADADKGDKLTFSISKKPAWLAFGTTNGSLTGTPGAAHVGIYTDIKIWVSDGKTKTQLPAFLIRVTAAANKPPTISGSPAKSARVGTAYSFQPSASDPNKDKLTFSISNKPAWASFNTGTGKLSGTPSSSYGGTTTSNIVIRVSDGKASAALPAFALTVSSSSTATTGTATLSWTPPTANEDGSALTNLAGHRIRYGTNRSTLNQTITVSNVGVTSYVVQNLTAGTWYFGVQAYNRAGEESDLSSIVSKTIR